MPAIEHRPIPTIKGDYTGTARDILAKDILDLRKYTDVDHGTLKNLIDLNKTMYKDAFKK